MEQFSLKLKHEISFDEDSYIVTDSNKEAYDWVKKWPNWGRGLYSNVCCIFGEKGSGKTHLTRIWQNSSNAFVLDKSLINDQSYFACSNNSFILEDFEDYLDKQKELFYFLNYIINSGKNLIITSSISLSSYNFSLQDLDSRVKSFFSVEIKKPDEDMVEKILVKYFSDRQISVESNVVHYLVNRIDRSYPAIASIVENIDKFALSKQRKISIPLIKSVCGF